MARAHGTHWSPQYVRHYDYKFELAWTTKILYQEQNEPGVVVHTSNSSSLEAERSLWAKDQPDLHSKL